VYRISVTLSSTFLPDGLLLASRDTDLPSDDHPPKPANSLSHKIAQLYERRENGLSWEGLDIAKEYARDNLYAVEL
jgi:hypothetical protein